MATIKDIANKLGIAVSTVSKGLNGAHDISDETRQLVLDTAIEMGYSTKKMRSQEEKKVCVFIENMDYENMDEFGYDIITGFKKAALRRNWDVSVIPVNMGLQTSENYDSYMLKQGFCGAFMVGFTLHENWLKQLDKTTVPTVLLDNYIKSQPRVGYVGTDSFEGIHFAVSHLVNLGHKKIAFLSGSKDSMVSVERTQAFIQSMAANGLTADNTLMDYGCYDPDCAKSHVPQFVANGATAIMCASDMIAFGVVHELKELNLRVPEDISVIGFDDLPIAESLTPSLTTIRQNRSDLGKSAASLLDNLLTGVAVSKILLRAEFIERNSTGRCKEL